MRRIRRHVSYSNVTATIALFVALAGGAYAATTLPKNSVGAKQLRKNAVTTAKIRKNAVTKAKIGSGAVDGSKVKDDSLTGSDVAESSLAKVPAASLADNATSLGGRPAGAYAANVAIRSKTLALPDNGLAGTTFGGGADDGTVSCAPGEHVIGGGVQNVNPDNDEFIVSSRPVVGDSGTPANGGTANGWRGVAGDSGAHTGGSTITVYAICAS